MTQDDKELLLKDLCARLPYNVKIAEMSGGTLTTSPRTDVIYVIENGGKPYLRPISSMTEEEQNEYEGLCLDNLALPTVKAYYNRYISTDYLHIDWLNAHHFDYRRLIEKGLALEAKEGMYK